MNKHVSKCNSDIDIPTKIKDVDITQNLNDNQHKNVNIPPVNMDIPSSQTNLPNYNPSSIYQYKYKPVRTKLNLKIDPSNDKVSFSVVIHRTLWKSIFDIKQYVMERNPEYIYDRQTIKYMGEVLSNKDITFEEMNSKSDMTFDIVIEK